MATEDRVQTSMQSLISLAEAADQFGISVKTLRRRIAVSGHAKLPIGGHGTAH